MKKILVVAALVSSSVGFAKGAAAGHHKLTKAEFDKADTNKDGTLTSEEANAVSDKEVKKSAVDLATKGGKFDEAASSTTAIVCVTGYYYWAHRRSKTATRTGRHLSQKEYERPKRVQNRTIGKQTGSSSNFGPYYRYGSSCSYRASRIFQ